MQNFDSQFLATKNKIIVVNLDEFPEYSLKTNWE